MLPRGADVLLVGMTKGSRRATKPLITSTLVLRALAAAITLSSFGGMTIFASENLHTSSAPLQPAAVVTATPTPTTVTTGRTTTRRSVTSTNAAPLTRTKQS
jgi:methyl coenzyme M reductase subunit C